MWWLFYAHFQLQKNNFGRWIGCGGVSSISFFEVIPRFSDCSRYATFTTHQSEDSCSLLIDCIGLSIYYMLHVESLMIWYVWSAQFNLVVTYVFLEKTNLFPIFCGSIQFFQTWPMWGVWWIYSVLFHLRRHLLAVGSYPKSSHPTSNFGVWILTFRVSITHWSCGKVTRGQMNIVVLLRWLHRLVKPKRPSPWVGRERIIVYERTSHVSNTK